MLQAAYLARQNSENAFFSLEEKVSQFQKKHPTAIYCELKLRLGCMKQELIDIAQHFASLGYDVECKNNSSLDVIWTFSEKGLTGKIYIDNGFCHYTQDASYQDK